MTREEFLKVSKELYRRGYHRNFKMKDLYEPNYGDSRAINQLFFRPWSLWEFRDRLPDSNNWLSFEPIIMFGRSSDERIDLSLQYPDRSIDELEQIAKDFGEWCKQNIREVED